MNGLEIQIKDLNLVLSGNEILENINLTVKAGEIHCLVGPNGGGKTSLLRCVLGQMPFTGSIEMKYEKDKIIDIEVYKLSDIQKANLRKWIVENRKNDGDVEIFVLNGENQEHLSCGRVLLNNNSFNKFKEIVDENYYKISIKE